MGYVKYFGNSGPNSVVAKSTADFGLKPNQKFNNGPLNTISSPTNKNITIPNENIEKKSIVVDKATIDLMNQQQHIPSTSTQPQPVPPVTPIILQQPSQPQTPEQWNQYLTGGGGNSGVHVSVTVVGPDNNSKPSPPKFHGGGGGGSGNLPDIFNPPKNAITDIINNPPINDNRQSVLPRQQFDNAINQGYIQGYSGQVLTDRQMAKAMLLTDIESSIKKQSIPYPKQYGTYYVGVTPEGKEILQKLRSDLPLTEQLPRVYEQVESAAPEIKPTYSKQYLETAPIVLESGTVLPITAEDIAALSMGSYGFLGGSVKFGLSGLFSKQITELNQKYYVDIIPQSNTGFSLSGAPQQVGRGALFLSTATLTGPSYALELSKGLLTNPIETTTGLYTYAKQNPYEIATISTEPFYKSSLPKIRTLEIPRDIAEPYSIKALGIEARGKAVIIGSKGPSGLRLGTPDVAEYLKELPSTKEIKIGSAIETKILQKSIQNLQSESTPRALSIIPIAQELIRESLYTKSGFIDKAELTTPTERLSREGIQVFLDIAKEDKGILFGSKSRSVQLAKEYNINGEEFVLNKVPRDIELRFDKATEGQLQTITNKAVTNLKKLGKVQDKETVFDYGTAREIKETPFAIEAKVNNVFEKVAEFKGKESVIEGEQVPEYVAGFTKTGKPMKLQGVKLTTLREELRGTAQGVLRVRIDKESGLLDIFPSPKRVKDIGSVSVTSRTLQLSKVFGKNKYLENINKFESLFPEELVRSQVRKVLTEPEKELLADFSKEPRSDSGYLKLSTMLDKSMTTYPGNRTLSQSMSNLDKSMSKLFSPSPSRSKSVSISKGSSSPSPYSPPSPKPSPSPSRSSSPSRSPYRSRSPSPSFSESPYKYLEEPKKKKGGKPMLWNYKRKGISLGNAPTFTVQIKRHGKFKSAASNLTKNEAIAYEQKALLRSLGRTGRIRPTGKTKEIFNAINEDNAFINKKIFRDYRISKGKPVFTPNQLIQKRRFSLSTFEEKSQIRESRRLKKLLG